MAFPAGLGLGRPFVNVKDQVMPLFSKSFLTHSTHFQMAPIGRQLQVLRRSVQLKMQAPTI